MEHRMADSIEVRRLAPSDAAELARGLTLLAGAAEREGEARAAAPVEHLAASLATPSCYVLLATEAGAPVGFVSAYRFPRLDHASDQAYVFDIEVAPAARRRGVGRRLLTALLAACWADGVTWAWAGTARENAAARRLFEAVGGEEVGETYVEFEFAPEE
jgi:ribosomal protein S18 acetylase RimI-like enzyme